MKCLFCLAVAFLFLTVANGTVVSKTKGLYVEPYAAIYGDENETILKEGIKNKKIACFGSQRSQKLEWYDPQGELVKQSSSITLVRFTELASSRPGLTLIFSSTRASDSGVWECRSGDEVRKVSLCIMDPAEGLAEDVTVDEGRSVTLSCVFRGNPEPRIQWYRREQLIVDDGEKYFTCTKYNRHSFEGQLTIKSVTAEDQDEYTCKGIQEHPEDLDLEHCIYTTTVNMSLNVNHAPRYLDKEYSENIAEFSIFAQDGENITLLCNPSAYPEPEFRWFTGNLNTEYSSKHFNVTFNGQKSVLPLVGGSATYGREFICKAKNDYGELISTFKVLKKEKPRRLIATSDFNARERTLCFNITFDSDIVFPVDGFVVQYFEKVTIGEPKEWQWEMAKTSEFTDPDFDPTEQCVPLPNLKINTEYWVRLRAYNDLGSADWSPHILASTAYENHTSGFPGVLIGIIVTIAIIVFAGGCILVIKRV